MGIRFEFFEAGCGDSILVSTDDEQGNNLTNILIDGGVSSTYQDEISYRLDDVNKLDLVVVTHIDNDHICGIMELLNDKYNRSKIKQLWFNMASEDMMFTSNNSNEIGQGQGNLFTYFISKYQIPYTNNIYLDKDEKNNIFFIGSEITLKLLSPYEKDLKSLRNNWKDNNVLRDCNKQKVEIGASNRLIDRRELDTLYDIKFGLETSPTNKTSIAFILEYKDKKFLLLGDADIKTINEELKKFGYSKNNKLYVEFVKLSHHGSKNNINSEFLDLVKTDTFITLTDGNHPNNSKYKHPDKETYALVLQHEDRVKNINFYFNYDQPIKKKFPRDMEEEVQYSFQADKKNTLRF